jgi:GNAT superfamily N-acetyltransferase
MVRVRPARIDEANALTALCIRSKAHWGYDAAFMRQAAGALSVTPTMIEQGSVLVAEDTSGAVWGVAAVAATQAADKFDLALLFVEPTGIRTGIGRVLFQAAVQLARKWGGGWLRILADPFAAEFYRRLGAAQIGEAPSDAIPGRNLPLFEYCLVGTAR